MWCRIGSPGTPWMSCRMTGHSAPGCSGSTTTARWTSAAQPRDPRVGGAGDGAEGLVAIVQLGAADGRHGAVIGKPRRLGLVGKRQAPPSEPRRRAPNAPIRAVVAQVVARRSWKPRPTLPATSRSIAEDMKAIAAVRSRQRHPPLARRRQRRHQVLRTTLRASTNYFRFDPELGHIAATQQLTRTLWLGHPWLVDP